MESIRALGLLHPVVRDKDGIIIDGRRRLIGCRLAGVEPRFETLPEGWDPADHIISANCYRYQHTASERAEMKRLAEIEMKETR